MKVGISILEFPYAVYHTQIQSFPIIQLLASSAHGKSYEGTQPSPFHSQQPFSFSTQRFHTCQQVSIKGD